jgi:hypothetical protein
VIYLYEAMGLVTLVLWLYCLFDVITTPDELCRNVPKTLWVVIVFLAPLIGSLVWLLAGRPQRAQGATRPTALPGLDRPDRPAATGPDDDEEFLRRCRERAEEQRRNAPKKPAEED